ncbi:MAG: hypothetical protein COB08_004210 [Rhodobacteraceae bacterium]|nr:hypothetical protein [Paracoccaceae bacterium]
MSEFAALLVALKASRAAPLSDFTNGIENGDIDDMRQQAKDILASLNAHPRAELAPNLIADVHEHVEAHVSRFLTPGRI